MYKLLGNLPNKNLPKRDVTKTNCIITTNSICILRTINNTTITRVTETKYLGLIIDSSLIKSKIQLNQ